MSLLLRGASKHWRELCWKAHQAFLWQHLKMWGVSHHNTNPLWQLSHIHIDPKLLRIKPVKKNITFPCSILASFHPFFFLSFLSLLPLFPPAQRKIHLLILRLKSFRGLYYPSRELQDESEVSISSDVNGSAIGTGEIKKTHIHLLLLYIHIIFQILSRQSHQLFLYAIIFKLLSMMHFCYSQFRSCSRGWVQHAQHESGLIMIEERTNH